MKNWTARFSLLIAILLITFVLLLPQILSSSLGKPFFLRILEKKLQGNIEVKELSLSWLGPQVFQSIHYISPDLEASIEKISSQVPLWFLTELNASFLLENGNFVFKERTIQQVYAELKNNHLKAKGRTEDKGYFSIEGKVYSKQDFDVFAEGDNLPATAMDSLLQTKDLFRSILGSNFDVKGRIVFREAEKEANVSLSSPNLTTSLHATLTDEALLLKEPLKVTFQLTESSSSALISHFDALFITGIRAKQPILLTLSEKGFNLPIPFSLKNLQIENGFLDMGQIECRSNKPLNSLVTLLKDKNPSNQFNLWFTPVAFQLKEGVLRTGRMDALLDHSIHVCTWGSINIIKDSLNMFLGIPADTLSHLFGIKSVHPNYVLKIPIHGSIQEPELETGIATAKIAAMVAAQQKTKAKKFLNPLIHIFSSIKEDQDAPEPKRPFPWEK